MPGSVIGSRTQFETRWALSTREAGEGGGFSNGPLRSLIPCGYPTGADPFDTTQGAIGREGDSEDHLGIA